MSYYHVFTYMCQPIHNLIRARATVTWFTSPASTTKHGDHLGNDFNAATALNQEPDHPVISPDHVYDQIPGITRIDPRDLHV